MPTRNRGIAVASSVFWLCGILFLEVIMVRTFSRGAWVANVAAVIYLWANSAVRKSAAVCLFVFFVALILSQGGLARMHTMLEVKNDDSIGHRIMLWRGTLAMCYDFFITGTGSKNWSAIYDCWYKPIELHEHYRTAVNQTLTIAAYYGLAPVAIVTATTFCLCWGLGTSRKKSTSALCDAALASQISFFVGGIFSCFIEKRGVLCCYMASTIVALVSFGVAVRPLRLNKQKLVSLRRVTIASAGVGLLTAILIWVAGMYYTSGIPVLPALPYALPQLEKVVIWSARPRNEIRPSSKRLLWFADSGGREEWCERFLRPLCQKGMDVVIICGTDKDLAAVVSNETAMQAIVGRQIGTGMSQALYIGASDEIGVLLAQKWDHLSSSFAGAILVQSASPLFPMGASDNHGGDKGVEWRAGRQFGKNHASPDVDFKNASGWNELRDIAWSMTQQHLHADFLEPN